jgi:hypothetical protein
VDATFVVWKIEQVGPCTYLWTIYGETADVFVLARLIADVVNGGYGCSVCEWQSPYPAPYSRN